jgi:hypothetical protein
MKTKAAVIYPPPQAGLPYLLVYVGDDNDVVSATPHASEADALKAMGDKQLSGYLKNWRASVAN